MKQWFSLNIREDILRKMSRAEYYEAQRYCRLVRRRLSEYIKPEAMQDLINRTLFNQQD